MVSCSSDDDNTTTGPNNNNTNATGLPDLSALAIPIPAAMQNAAGGNAGAAEAVGYITTLNSFAFYTAWLVPGGTAKVAATNDTTITWTENGLTITLTVTAQDSTLDWTTTLSGTIDDETYENFVLVSGQTKDDGTYGNMSIFAEGPSGPQEAISWVWSTTSTGTFTVEYILVEGGFSVDVELFADGHGVVRQRVGGNILYVGTWNSDGTGSYINYDAQGNVIGSGSWT